MGHKWGAGGSGWGTPAGRRWTDEAVVRALFGSRAARRTKGGVVRAGFLPQWTKPRVVRAFLRNVRPHHGPFCPQPRASMRMRPHHAAICPIYPYKYNVGGNFSEAISSGRLAMRSASKLESWE